MNYLAPIAWDFFLGLIGALIGAAFYYAFTTKVAPLSLIAGVALGSAFAKLVELTWPSSANYINLVIGISVGACVGLTKLIGDRLKRLGDRDLSLR